MDPGRGVTRQGRTALFSLTAVATAVVAHRAGGAPVSPVLAVLLVPAVMLLVNPLAGRRRRALTLLTGMGLLQAGLHLVLMTAADVAGCHLVEAAAAHHHAGSTSAMVMDCGMGHAAAPEPGLFSLMTALHALAAVLLTLLLARSDAALWSLARCLGFTGLLVAEPWNPLLPAARVVRRHWDVPARPQLAVVAKVVRRRGPPVLVLVP